MDLKYLMLSETEMDIMLLLWEAGMPLSRPEILNRLAGKDWNPNSIHQVLNSMMKKGVLQVDGMTRCGKIYGRTYKPTMTQQEFVANQIHGITTNLTPQKRLLGVVAALSSQDPIDEDTIEALEDLLKTKQKEFSKK